MSNQQSNDQFMIDWLNARIAACKGRQEASTDVKYQKYFAGAISAYQSVVDYLKEAEKEMP